MKPRPAARLSFPLASALAALFAQLAAPTAQATSYYWDNNGATAGFNFVNGITATYGVWTTSIGTTYGWSTSSAGTVAAANVTTQLTDDLNFGYTTTGLTPGTITVSGTQNANSLTFAIGSGTAPGPVTLSGGTINLSATGTITVNNASDVITSVISGAATSFTKAGSGTLLLSGANTYTGQTLVSGGTLVTSTAAALPGYTAASQVIFSGGTIAAQVGGSGWTTAQVDALLSSATKTSGALGLDTTNGDLTQWSAFTTTNLGSTLGLSKRGSNTLTLDQVNSYAGTTTLSGGTLNLLNSSSGLAQTLGGPLVLSGFGEVVLQSTNAGTGILSTGFGALTRSAGNSTNFVSVGGSNGTDNIVTLTGAAGFIDKGFFFGGSSYAALSASNGYVTAMAYDGTNNTALSNTITAANHVQLTATPAAQNTLSLLSLNLAGGGVSYPQNASQTLTVPAILKSGGGSVSTLSGGTAVTGGTGTELLVRTDAASDLLTLSTPVTGSGALTKSGAGTLTLSGANAYTGNTYINGGTLEVSGTLGSGNYIQTIYIGKGATLLYDGSAAQKLNGAVLAGEGNLTVAASGSGGVIFGDKPTNPQVYTGTTTLNSGFLRTYGAGMGSGNLTVNGGYLDDYYGNAGNFTRSLGAGAGQVQILGGTSGWSENGNTSGAVVLNNDASTVVQWGSAYFNPSTLILQAATAQTSSSLTFQNKIDLNGATRTITTSGGTTGAASATLPGVISNNAGTAGLTKTGGGTLKLTAANTFNGLTTVSAGILSLGNTAALQNSVLDATNSITGNATNGLKTTVTTLILGGLNGSKDLSTLFTSTSGGYTAVTALTLNPATSDSASYSAAIANGAAAMTLTKSGAGTQTLAGASTYTGATTVNAGTLALGAGGSINTSATINVGGAASYDVSAVTGGYHLFSGQTLMGTGTVLGGMTANSGIIAPGAGVSGGTLTFGSGTFALASGAKVQVGNPGSSLLQISGDFTDDLTAHAVFFVGTPTLGTPYPFLQWTGSTPAGVGDGTQGNWSVAQSGAATSTWLDTSSNNWANAGSWDGLGGAVTADTGTKTLSFTVTQTGAAPSATTDVTLDPTASGIVVTGPAAPAVAIKSLQLGGTNNQSPTLTLGAASFTVTGAVNVLGNGSLNATAGGLIAATLTVNGSGAAATLGNASGAITTANVSAGSLTVNAGTLSTAVLSGTGSLAGAQAVPQVNVTGGTPAFSGNATTLTLSGGALTFGANARVATLDLSNPGSGSADASANPLVITSTLKLPGGITGTLTGGGSVTAAGTNLADNSVARTLALSGGTLALTHPSAASVTLTNPSFESDAGTVNSYKGQAITGWTGGTGVEQGTSKTFAPVAGNANPGLPGYNASTNYKWAYIQGAQTMSQSFNVAATGNYTVSFAEAGRAGGTPAYGPLYVQAQVDATNVTSVLVPSTSVWTAVTSGSVPLAAGSHTLSFVFTNPLGGDKSSVLDAVAIAGTTYLNINLPNTSLAVTASSTLDLGAASGSHTLGNLALANSGTQLTLAGAASLAFNSLTAGGNTALLAGGTALSVPAATSVHLGGGAALVFADSSASNWSGGTLTLSGTFVSGSSLRFGTTSGGLTSTQLALISASGFSSFALDASGFLTATATGGYAAWSALYAAGQDPSADANHDGVPNGIAYFMGMNGLASNPGVVNGKVTWPHVGIVGAFAVEVSTDLVNWTAADPAAVDATSNPAQVVFTLPVGAARKFCRLSVTP